MRLCIPTDGGTGTDAQVYGHFGSAPVFVIHDTATGETRAIGNAKSEHEHGACNPLATISGETIDAVVVGGIGARALMAFNGAGIRVFRAVEGTVADNASAAEEGTLLELTPENSCSNHEHGCD